MLSVLSWPACPASVPSLTIGYRMLCFAALLLCGCASVRPPPASPVEQPEAGGPLASSRQLVVVTTDAWSSTAGLLQRFERDSVAADWHPVGPAFAVVLGSSGLAWGRGIHGEAPATETLKREGDGKSPAGIFALSEIFGYAPAFDSTKTAHPLPYIEARPSTECVDDPASRHYNTLLDRTGVSVDWNSAEQMRRDDDMYRLGAVVDHNTAPALPGGGSCIFIHIWESPTSTTAGCTAGDAANIAGLLAWLDRTRAPRLVQLPRDTYMARAKTWKLPALLPVTRG